MNLLPDSPGWRERQTQEPKQASGQTREMEQDIEEHLASNQVITQHKTQNCHNLGLTSRVLTQTWLGCMYSSRYVLQSRLSQSSVMCPPYMISPNRYLRSSHGTFIMTNAMKIKLLKSVVGHGSLHALSHSPSPACDLIQSWH